MSNLQTSTAQLTTGARDRLEAEANRLRLANRISRFWRPQAHRKVRIMAQPTKFWDKIADHYSKQPIADEAAYQKKLQVTQAYFQPEMEVLEIGCGTGSTALIHAPYVKHIRAIDFSANMNCNCTRQSRDPKYPQLSPLNNPVLMI